ncbi:MAG TPA: hypothetical protein PLT68_04100 [Actinomycetota bacterium]|nr:hypothetical protein [Actinomycetota bacterium]
MDTQRIPEISTEQPQDEPWQTMYTSERKKARILGATTVAASLLAVAMGAWGLTNAGDSSTAQTQGPGGTSQFGPPGQTGTLPGQTGTGTGTGTAPQQGGPGQDLSALLFNSDGSVNTEALEQFQQNAPGGTLEQFLAMAVQNGDLTQEQADQLTAAAAGTSTSSSGTSSQDT